MVSSYGAAQRLDHEKYDSMYDPTNPLTSDIPLNERGDPWDSHDNLRDGPNGAYHSRQESAGSVDTVMADKVQGYSDNYNYSAYPPPAGAYTQDPGPTPRVAYDNYYDTHNNTNNTYSGGVGYPERSQPHPGES